MVIFVYRYYLCYNIVIVRGMLTVIIVRGMLTVIVRGLQSSLMMLYKDHSGVQLNELHMQ